MKKKVLSLMLTLAMTATLFAGCGGSDDAGSNNAANNQANAGTEEVGGSTGATGSVYMLNFKPEVDQQWKDLAAIYTAQTGVQVDILTAAGGEYSTTMQAEMGKENAPTIFNIGNATAAQTWNDYTYDLSETALYDHLADKSLVVNYGGKVAAVANCYECYGIIYNKTILHEYAINVPNAVIASVDEIDNFETLNAVATDINNRVDEINEILGTNLTGAFASSGLDSGSSWRFSGHLAGVALYYDFLDAGCDLVAGQGTVAGTYLDNFKAVWDMYVGTSSADPKTLESGVYNAETEFGMGEAVFFQNGNWEYAALTNPDNGFEVTAEDLGMMPIYFGVDDANQGLCVGTENYWAVNAKAPQEDIDATLAFLEWVITSDEGRDAITNKMGLSAPFDTFTGEFAPSNVFSQDNNAYAAAGKTAVAWSFNATPNVDTWRADLVTPLTAYTHGAGSWDAVVSAFVDGWATQWQLAEEAK
ncbi:MAG: ABC transporter substrate-binding protein [Lachnospiraceae bacterium]|nr:ABC transporter substrate-binding protein [Lachnospiraceae bacterium]